jgi:hypothetical protein
MAKRYYRVLWSEEFSSKTKCSKSLARSLERLLDPHLDLASVVDVTADLFEVYQWALRSDYDIMFLHASSSGFDTDQAQILRTMGFDCPIYVIFSDPRQAANNSTSAENVHFFNSRADLMDQMPTIMRVHFALPTPPLHHPAARATAAFGHGEFAASASETDFRTVNDAHHHHNHHHHESPLMDSWDALEAAS